MTTTPVSKALILMVRDYLLAQDTKRMVDCVPTHAPELLALAEIQDRLGWDNFVEGRISKLFLSTATPIYRRSYRKGTARQWGRKLVNSPLQLTHKQWLFRNSHVHIRKVDGMTEAEHEELFDQVRDQMLIGPSELLERHQSLLEGDFTELGKGSSSVRKQWVCSMEAAVATAEYVNSGRPIYGELGDYSPSELRSTRL